MGSSPASRWASPHGVRTATSSLRRSSNVVTAFRAPMPAHLAKPGAAPGRSCAGSGAPARGSPRPRRSPAEQRSTRGPTCTLPPDRQRAGERGVAKVVAVRPQRPPRVVVPHPLAAEQVVHANGQILGTSRILPASGSRPSVKTAWSRAAITYTWYRGPHTCASEGSSKDERPGAFHARLDRQQRRTRHAVLDPGPRHLPQRRVSGRESLLEGADPPPERKDLRSCGPQPPPWPRDGRCESRGSAVFFDAKGATSG